MDFIEKPVSDGAGNPLGILRYAKAGALLPFGQQQFTVQFLDIERQEIGGIRSVRTVPFEVLVQWRNHGIRYPDDLKFDDAIALGEKLFKGNPQDTGELKELVNDFARKIIEEKSKGEGGVEVG